MRRRGLAETAGRKAARKLAARQRGPDDIYFWLGMFGLVGWSVAVPTLLGIALGLWLDARWPTSFSWTLTLLAVGMGLGCLNAWHWINRSLRGRQERSAGEDGNERD
jgi:ATP synthase protein I